MKKINFVWLFVAFVMLVPTSVSARDVIPQNPTADELVNALKPTAKRKMKFRSIRPVIKGKTTAAVKEEKPEKRSVNLTINFEFNSATLTPSSKKSLNTLGEALNSSALNEFSFEVIGHTDSKGSADYNRELSSRRAASVKSYLVEKCDVDGKRLESIGKGESKPIDKNNPESAANRRVEIVNTGA